MTDFRLIDAWCDAIRDVNVLAAQLAEARAAIGVALDDRNGWPAIRVILTQALAKPAPRADLIVAGMVLAEAASYELECAYKTYIAAKEAAK